MSALLRLGLIPDESILRARLWRLCVAGNSLNRRRRAQNTHCAPTGPHQYLFLVLLAVFFVFIAIRVHNPFRTRRGDALLADLRNLFSSLKTGGDASPRRRNCRCRIVDGDFWTRRPPRGFIPLREAVPARETRFFDQFVRLRLAASSSGSSCGGGGGGGRRMRWELNHERSFRHRLAA